jgi:tRNA-specific 2-thiouridylase
MTLLNSDTLIENRVVVAMSGGVDSSVAAALLVEQGYEVVGMMMRLWSEPGAGGAPAVNRCCTPDQMADARRVADQLGIPFYAVDVQDHFRRTIVQYFIDQHGRGRTPNPCIECNRQIRFTYLLNQALALDANYLATGHYARVEKQGERYLLRAGVDRRKDQSYVLHVLNQEKLAHTLFPIGEYTKEEVRELARDFGLPVAAKSDSQDLCFLGDGDYRRFLREYGDDDMARPGPILNQAGEELGQHDGLPFYTIGQRKGLGVSVGHAVYVLGKDAARNALIVGPRAALEQTELVARDVNWVSGRAPAEPISAQVKIRYKARGVPAVVEDGGNGRVHIRFRQPVFGITAGQGAVFYDGDICLGGGVISDAETASKLPATIDPAQIPAAED